MPPTRIIQIHHDCKTVEREAIGLHSALVEAIRRIQRLNGQVPEPARLQVADLMKVLDDPDAPVMF